MIAEVIAIGDELTSGQRLDTNSQWLSQELGQLGIRVLYHSTVGDDLPANVDLFRQSVRRADVIVVTGGLGPTADDLTRQALADAAGVELVKDETALRHIQQLFAKRNRPMPERNVVQAMFPRGSSPIPNPHGTAPGVHQTFAREDAAPVHLFALPGVPAEMREMWAATVHPTLNQLLGNDLRVIRHCRVKCFGVGESDLEQMLPDLVRRGQQPTVGITVSEATITLRISADGRTEEECASLIGPTVTTIHKCLGELVFGSEDDELQHAVIRSLAANSKTLATVECGPGGLLANWLSEVDPEGTVFLGGTIIRQDRLALPMGSSNSVQTGASGLEAVGDLAQRTREQLGANFALAVGPFPASDDPTPKVHLALASAEGVVTHEVGFTGHPAILKARCTKQALNLLRLSLL